mmetsp:Transcript_114389/g.227622  ORF Transcript_114389/g.227622 Transcript_114389/m.227622 type:complete len:284 (+) Transcript_114389:62-913(+)
MGSCGLKNIMIWIRIWIRLLCGPKRAGVSRRLVIERAQRNTLEVYQGYTEQPVRCICEIEDGNAEAKIVETIMPHGYVEMEGKFKPRKGKALVTFGRSQYIRKDLARRFVLRPDGGCPFIHDESAVDGEVYPLAQTWTVNLNKRFYETFEQIDESTVDGLRTFKECMTKLFSSSEVDKYPIRCYKMRRGQVNPELVFVGPRDLMAVFLQDSDVQTYFSISANRHGFKSWSIPKGKWFPRAKSFLWGSVMDDQVVLFTREGNSSMTVMVSKEQFLREKQFGEKL